MCSDFRHTTALVLIATIWVVAAPRVEAALEINPQIVVSNTNPLIGEPIEFTVIGVPDIDGASWSFGGTACDGSSPVLDCSASPTDECTFQTFQYDSAGAKSIELTVTVYGVDYAAPQEIVLVQNFGDCGILQCQDLSAPAAVEVEDVACGGSTVETAPWISWQPVDNSLGYHWQIAGADGIVVDAGTTAAFEVTVEVGPLAPDTYIVNVQAQGDGTVYCDSEWTEGCPFTVVDEPAPATFTWWPEEPKVGERVRFADLIAGRVLSWFWDFGFGSTSDQQHPTHVYDAPGEYIVTRDVELETGHVVEQKTITVAGAVECGNGICESGETAWGCAADCALAPGETGRAGGSDRRPTVPAAGDSGEGGPSRVTEAWIYNPGSTEATVIVEFTPTGQATTAQAGPFTLEPKQSLYWSNAIRSLFGITGQGALWIDSTSPIFFFTRTSTAEPGMKRMPVIGSVGQEQIGIRERLTLGRGDGALYLLGLRQGGGHSSWLHISEVDGSPVAVRVDVFNNHGRRIGHKTFPVPGGTAKSIDMAQLGVRRGSAYAAVRVTDGTGHLAVTGTLADHFTGDRITVPALHGEMPDKSKTGETHQLVAAAFHRTGQFSATWRSGLAILNPTGISQTVRLVYESEFSHGKRFGGVLDTVLTLRPGQQLVWKDVLSQLFRLRKNAKTQGSLHVFHSGDLLVDSRVLNLQRKGGAVGSSLPALGAGDMIRVGETGVLIGLAHTPSTKTSLGLSEFTGTETDVEIALYSTGSGSDLLGTRKFTVPASAHLGINNLFEVFGLDENPIQPIAAEITTLRGGSVYPYIMTVNKKSGDPTIHLAARK